jgi:hypothetical protein
MWSVYVLCLPEANRRKLQALLPACTQPRVSLLPVQPLQSLGTGEFHQFAGHVNPTLSVGLGNWMLTSLVIISHL